MSNLLKSLNEKPIGFYRVYKRLTGNTNAALLLSQLMYWFSHKDKFFKTDSDIMEETELTKKELETAKIKLKKLDFLAVTREGIPAKTYYMINWEKYEKTLRDFVVGNKFPQKGETGENTDDEEDNIPKIEADDKNGETSFHKRGKLDSTKGGNWIPQKGETIYSKIKKTSSKTSSKNLSPKSSLTRKEEREDKKDFFKFLEITREKYKGNGINSFYPTLTFYFDKEIKVASNKHLYFAESTDYLSPSQAQEVWEYLFINPGALIPITKQGAAL
ncbi:hypothetical protein [Aquamicrobium sp.]|uniref:hypothetical protein n=1 Tax=Aquamicrobium sp. TaxID=1872579 RepID=UPI002582CEAF|nr:hypothetical protein [Aquamicrobium sp.]MCK9550429.1 hypothetical protein [Aquamicrobium sp.]